MTANINNSILITKTEALPQSDLIAQHNRATISQNPKNLMVPPRSKMERIQRLGRNRLSSLARLVNFSEL